MDNGRKKRYEAKIKKTRDEVSIRHFGVPGASLISADTISDEAAQLGIRGEKIVDNKLYELLEEFPNVYVFNSVKIPGNKGDIDHILVQGDKVLLLDSKYWGKKYTYSYSDEKDVNSDKIEILRDGQKFVGGTIGTLHQKAQWQKFLPDYIVEAAVVITNDTAIVDPEHKYGLHQQVNLSNLQNIHKVINKYFTKNETTPLDDSVVEKFVALLYSNQLKEKEKVAAERIELVTTYKIANKRAKFLTTFLVTWSIFNYIIGFPTLGGLTKPIDLIVSAGLVILLSSFMLAYDKKCRKNEAIVTRNKVRTTRKKLLIQNLVWSSLLIVIIAYLLINNT